MNQIKTRSSYWDNIKGLLILLTVFAHVIFNLQNQAEIINFIVDGIYMFHMPAFIFVSGYFGKSERSYSFKAVIKFIFLYFIFNSIMGFIYGFGSLLVPLYSYWYLIALIVWRLTAHHIAKFKEIQLILLTISIFIGFYPSINNTFAAARIIGFYPYYMAGYLLSAEKSRLLTDTPYKKRFAKGMLCLLGTVILAIVSYRCFQYSDLALQMSGYYDPSDAFGRIVLYIIAFLAIYVIRCIIPDKKLPLITTFGKNSLWIFLIHRPLTLLIGDAVSGKNIGFIFLIAVVSTLLISAVLGNNYISKYLDKFAESGAAIFTDTENKKITIAKLSALSVSLFFVISIVFNAYSDA